MLSQRHGQIHPVLLRKHEAPMDPGKVQQASRKGRLPPPRAPHPASAGVDAGWIRAHQHDPGVQLVDTRSAAEYARGHIPGAVHWDWNDGTPADGSGYFRGDHALRDELAARGIVADREIVTYCHSGVRAAHTYALLRAIGYPRVRLYDGSWLEWSTLHGAHA